MKIAKIEQEAFDLENKYPELPHGWIQWKGTDVCMDVHCKCGNHGHIDDEFVYYIKCKSCGTVYHVNGHVELIEIKNPQKDTIERAALSKIDEN